MQVSVKMNGFSSKVICKFHKSRLKSLSSTVWKILFNITISALHHKLRGFMVDLMKWVVPTTSVHPDRSVTWLLLWCAPQGLFEGRRHQHQKFAISQTIIHIISLLVTIRVGINPFLHKWLKWLSLAFLLFSEQIVHKWKSKFHEKTYQTGKSTYNRNLF